MIGAAPTASADELRQAYLSRARALHPDQSGDTAGMQKLNAAWEVLSDPGARAAYDRERAPVPAPALAADPDPRDEPFDPVSALLRALPVLVVLLLLFAVFVFTAYARGGPGDGVEEPSTVPVPSAGVD